MNKSTLWVKLTAYILLFVVLLGASFRLIVKTNDNFNFNLTNGESELMDTQSFSSIDNVIIDVTSDKIQIIEHNGNDYIVEYYTNAETNTAKISENDGTISIVNKPKKIISFSFIWQIWQSKIIIKVPKGSSLSYDIKGISGSVDVDAISGNLKIKTTSGSIEVMKGGKQLTADSISGSIKAYEPFEKINLDTTSGSIKLTANELTSEIRAKSVSGSIKIKKPESLGYSFSYDSVSGSIKDEYNENDFSKSGTSSTGDGKMKIDAKTISGSIKLTDW